MADVIKLASDNTHSGHGEKAVIVLVVLA